MYLCHCILHVCICHAQSCPTLCDPMDCSQPSTSVHGLLQERILEWVAISFSRDQTYVSYISLHWQRASLLSSHSGSPLCTSKWLNGKFYVIYIYISTKSSFKKNKVTFLMHFTSTPAEASLHFIPKVPFCQLKIALGSPL